MSKVSWILATPCTKVGFGMKSFKNNAFAGSNQGFESLLVKTIFELVVHRNKNFEITFSEHRFGIKNTAVGTISFLCSVFLGIFSTPDTTGIPKSSAAAY